MFEYWLPLTLLSSLLLCSCVLFLLYWLLTREVWDGVWWLNLLQAFRCLLVECSLTVVVLWTLKDCICRFREESKSEEQGWKSGAGLGWSGGYWELNKCRTKSKAKRVKRRQGSSILMRLRAASKDYWIDYKTFDDFNTTWICSREMSFLSRSSVNLLSKSLLISCVPYPAPPRQDRYCPVLWLL